MNNSANATAKALVDLQRYPIDDLSTTHGNAFANKCRQQYLETGLCMLPQFILPNAIQRLVGEATLMSEDAYFCRSSHNAYLSDDVSSKASDDVMCQMEETYVGSVAYDHIDENSSLKQLYLWDPLKDFIGYVLGKAPFYRFADPLGACSINVFVAGGEHGWHFDESEYTVTLMLQAPKKGGAFEYVPQIRGLPDEKEIVANVLNGARDRVVELPFSAGTLLIFGGNQTIHRVTRVSGEKPRLVPVLCYSETPDLVNSESVRKLFWGRTDSSDAATL